MLASMSSRQFAEWQAFYALEPFGDYRADLQAAGICLTMTRLWSSHRHKLADFMLDFEPREERSREVTQTIAAFLAAGIPVVHQSGQR